LGEILQSLERGERGKGRQSTPLCLERKKVSSPHYLERGEKGDVYLRTATPAPFFFSKKSKRRTCAPPRGKREKGPLALSLPPKEKGNIFFSEGKKGRWKFCH